MRMRLAWSLALGGAVGASAIHCGGGQRPLVGELESLDASEPDVAAPVDTTDAAAEAGPDDAASVVDAGPPSLTTSRQEIDFGKVGCGKAASPVTFSLNNTGTASFTWSATLLAGATSQFTLLPASGTLAPLASQTVTVTMNGVPFPGTTTDGFYDDLLTLTATSPSGSAPTRTEIPIKLTATGAVVRFTPSAVVFGSVPLNETSSASFGIRNDGNADVELDLVGTNARFATSPLGPVIVPAGQTATRTVTFSSVDVVPQTGEIKLASTSAANALCAPLPATGLAVSGVGSNGTAVISPGSLSFGDNGRVDCGTQADAETIQIKNTGNAAFNWTGKLTSGESSYTLSPSSGTVQPTQTSQVQVIPKPIPSESEVTDDLYAGTVEITTTAVNDPVHVVGLHQTARGVILTSSLGNALDFGGVKIATTATKTFSLTNRGNVPVTASLAVGGAPFVVTSSVTLGPSETKAPEVNFTPTTAAAYTDSLVVTTSAGPSLCAPLPDNATLKGSGSTAVSVSPASLGFGLVDCGTTASPQTVTLDNAGPAITFTAVFGREASSPYTLADDATGAPLSPATPIAVPAASTFVLRVIPKTVAPPATTTANAFGDTLTLTTTAAGDAPKVVQLNMTARGAFLAINPVSIAAQDAVCDHTKFYNFQVVNTGNLPGDYTVAAVPRATVPASTFTMNLASGSLFGGQSQAGVLEMHTPPNAGADAQYLGDIVLTPKAGTVLCSDAQPKAPLSLDTKCHP